MTSRAVDRSRVEWWVVAGVAHADLFCPTRPTGGRWAVTEPGTLPTGTESCEACAYAVGHEAQHPLL